MSGGNKAELLLLYTIEYCFTARIDITFIMYGYLLLAGRLARYDYTCLLYIYRGTAGHFTDYCFVVGLLTAWVYVCRDIATTLDL